MTGLERQLTEMLEAPVAASGYELVGLEFVHCVFTLITKTVSPLMTVQK